MAAATRACTSTGFSPGLADRERDNIQPLNTELPRWIEVDTGGFLEPVGPQPYDLSGTISGNSVVLKVGDPQSPTPWSGQLVNGTLVVGTTAGRPPFTFSQATEQSFTAYVTKYCQG